MTSRRSVTVAVTVALAVLGAAGCNDGSAGGGSGDRDKKIALLLPESKTTRYEQFDRPYFEKKVKALCADCQILYSNANQDKDKQQQQAEAALANGADVLVLDPVDSVAAATIAKTAAQRKVPVISYDRLITGVKVDYYVSFDNEKVGQLQAQSLVDKLRKDGKTSGNIVMINGSDTDNNAKLFNKGAHSVLDSSGFTILPKTDFFTPEWDPKNAQDFMDGQIATLGKTGFVGVYAANDGTAGGAIAAMRTAGVRPIPPVTGQDAELAAIQRILTGDQYMTVYKAIKPEAEKAAELAVALVNGEKPAGETEVDNGAGKVASFLLTPVAVTRDTIKDTVIKDGFYTTAQLCTAQYQQACTAAGVK